MVEKNHNTKNQNISKKDEFSLHKIMKEKVLIKKSSKLRR